MEHKTISARNSEKSPTLSFLQNSSINSPFSFVKKTSFSMECGEGIDLTHSTLMTESFNQFSISKSIEVLDLSLFKTQPCSSKTQHNYKTCFFYHNSKDRRRIGSFYSSELCEYAEKGPELCPLGDFCTKSHNRLEQLYHPDKYKTKFCSHFPRNVGNCEYGTYCSFAHAEHEILIDLIHNYDYDEDFFLFHYKTVWCPFNLTQHDKGLCVYAHNWQDFRRKPHLYTYEPVSCPNWNHNQIVVNYEEGCPNNFGCIKCHGWKENEFHPINYRTKPCPNINNCNRGFACPFFHSPKDKRVISYNVLTLCFKFFPRNRIISNTFKYRRNSATTINKSSISSCFNSLNPVIEEIESSRNRGKIEGLADFPEEFKQEMTDSKRENIQNQSFSTPSKRKLTLPEINRKFSETGPMFEKMYDRQIFMSQDNTDTTKHIDDGGREFLSYQLFGRYYLEGLDSKEEKVPSKKSEASSKDDDDFTDLVEEIKKLTQ